MELIDTSHIPNWPEHVLLAYNEMNDVEGIEVLSEKERKKFHSFKSEGRKAEYLNSRKLFRFLLAELGADPDSAQLLKYNGGKPYGICGENHMYVSFTHTPEKVFCAISKEIELGLDSEVVSRKVKPRVLNRILNKSERESLHNIDPIVVWTIKEAAVKFLGTGLGTHMDDHTIVKTKKNRYSVRFNDDKLIEICSFRQSDHQIALAYQSKHI
ncbi:4'-phosphopantetheinyl transferase family protein [Gracilimonas sp.]|uniref:4'-phosphopantetheinyl transferase family protein n=1 Tax=Gracilimonas sp. TaxID=1974203 RepID=UPI00287259CC|nr:4'-phosphopantetheinyl transferase superfamily protein [Gracilimonas sp.]